MRASFVTASLMSVLVVAASQQPFSRAASAADLYGEDYSDGAPPSDYDDEAAPPQTGYSYDRGRYSEAPPPDRYDEPYDRYSDPPRGSIKDGYPVPVPPPVRYSEPPSPPPRHERFACLDRWQIKRTLRNEGWVDLRPLGGDGERVRIRARRVDNGRVFMLRVDRCSGEILAARPEYLRTFAFRERDDYWRAPSWDRNRY